MSFTARVHKFCLDDDNHARTSVMTWLAFTIVAGLFSLTTLYTVFVKPVMTAELVNWFFWGATVILGAPGGLNAMKTFLQARTGVNLTNATATVAPSTPLKP